MREAGWCGKGVSLARTLSLRPPPIGGCLWEDCVLVALRGRGGNILGTWMTTANRRQTTRPIDEREGDGTMFADIAPRGSDRSIGRWPVLKVHRIVQRSSFRSPLAFPTSLGLPSPNPLPRLASPLSAPFLPLFPILPSDCPRFSSPSGSLHGPSAFPREATSPDFSIEQIYAVTPRRLLFSPYIQIDRALAALDAHSQHAIVKSQGNIENGAAIRCRFCFFGP